MIRVEIKKEKNIINEITINGHANYASLGKDIVCSAVSSIVITTINGINLIDKNAINYSNNNDTLDIKIVKHDDITDKLIINMVNMLYELEEQYPKNIKIL